MNLEVYVNVQNTKLYCHNNMNRCSSIIIAPEAYLLFLKFILIYVKLLTQFRYCTILTNIFSYESFRSFTRFSNVHLNLLFVIHFQLIFAWQWFPCRCAVWQYAQVVFTVTQRLYRLPLEYLAHHGFRTENSCTISFEQADSLCAHT